MLYWGPVTTGVKNLIRCRIKELFDIKRLIISVQRYNKSPPRTKWTFKVSRLNFQGNFRSTLERCLPTCVSFLSLIHI